MSLVINTNTASLNAQRQLMRSGDDLDKATARLSSGKRINSAGDDAAGLAISNRMTSQVRGLDQAIRNANDGISLIQVTEGALNETTNMLQRIRELSVQASNGIYTNGDRATLNAEVQQLIHQVDFVAKNTQFNGIAVLDGSQSNISLQVGAQANQTVAINIPAMSTKSLGLGSTSGDLVGAEMTVSANGTLTNSLAASALKINGKTIESVPAGSTVQTLLDKINEADVGVSASTIINLNAGSVGTGVIQGSDTFTISGVDLKGVTQSFTVNNTTNLKQLADKITEKSGGIFNASVDDTGHLILNSSSMSTVTVVDSTSGTASGMSVGSNPDPNVNSIVQALQTGWIAESENLISTYFGMTGDGVNLTLDINPIGDPESDGPSNNIASVSWSSSPGQKGTNLELNIDMADFTPANLPNGNLVAGIIYSDRIVAHEMVHAVMTRNMPMDTLPGWFTEGVAEFIHGADERVKGDISSGALDTLAEFQAAFTAAQAVGSPSAVGYSAGYVAVKMLHQSIIKAGGTGIDEVFARMKVPGPSQTLDQALQFVSAAHSVAAWSDLSTFNTWVSNNGFDFMTSVANVGLTTALGVGKASLHLDGPGPETDTGSVAGSDYGFAAISNANVLLDTSGLPAQHFNFVIPPGVSGGSQTADAQLVLTSTTGSSIEISKGSAGTDTNLSSLGLSEIVTAKSIIGTSVTPANQITATNVGDIKINGVDIGAVTASSGLMGKINAMNAVSDQTGVKASLISENASTFNTTATNEFTFVNANASVPSNGAISINGYAMAVTAGQSYQQVAATINTAHSTHGATAYVDESGKLHLFAQEPMNLAETAAGLFTAAGGYTLASNAGSVKIKGIEISLTDTSNITTVVNDLNARQASTGVAARVDENGKLELKGDSTFSIAIGNTSGLKSLFALGISVGLGASGTDLSDTDSDHILTDESYQVYSRVKLISEDQKTISVDVSANGATATGLKDVNVGADAIQGASLRSLNILTQAAAQKSIKVVDNALTTINTTRSNLGATNNRLDFTISNLSNIAEKTTAALSRIVDADFAVETSKLSRSQVLQQAAQAMLAQANQRPQQVLSLLR